MAAPRSVWIDEGSDADYAKLRAYGIGSPCYSIRDPRVTLSYLENVRGQGFAPGVYAAWNWYPSATGRTFATIVSRALERIAPNTPGSFPFVCLDIETHDVAYVLAALAQWRRHRPGRATDWTLEGMQGGLFSQAAVDSIAAANVRVVPQSYTGSMQAMDAVEVALDLTKGGWTTFPRERLALFYDAAQLPPAWQGYAFTQGRLP